MSLLWKVVICKLIADMANQVGGNKQSDMQDLTLCKVQETESCMLYVRPD